MSALDLDETIRRSIATLLEASYWDDIPSVTTDRWRWVAADASRDLTALITRLRAAEARTAWQPIETAPVGVEVMVTWVDRQGLRHMSGGILLGTHWWTHGRVVTPTHWQPLPAPPASEVSRD